MERPSHSHFKTSHPFPRRLASLGLAVSFPLAVLWGLIHGLTASGFKIPDPMQLVPIKDAAKPDTLPPPPDPRMQEIPMPRVEQPIFQTEREQGDDGIAMPGPGASQASDKSAAGPDRAAAGVMSTHTTPPYPMLAQRLGVEGKVTLRLTVLPDGTVGKAEIVASSGRGELDEAAEQWIMAHWIYKPALEKGEPVPSQTLATVIFSLRNQR